MHESAEEIYVDLMRAIYMFDAHQAPFKAAKKYVCSNANTNNFSVWLGEFSRILDALQIWIYKCTYAIYSIK